MNTNQMVALTVKARLAGFTFTKTPRGVDLMRSDNAMAIVDLNKNFVVVYARVDGAWSGSQPTTSFELAKVLLGISE